MISWLLISCDLDCINDVGQLFKRSSKALQGADKSNWGMDDTVLLVEIADSDSFYAEASLREAKAQNNHRKHRV